MTQRTTDGAKTFETSDGATATITTTGLEISRSGEVLTQLLPLTEVVWAESYPLPGRLWGIRIHLRCPSLHTAPSLTFAKAARASGFVLALMEAS